MSARLAQKTNQGSPDFSALLFHLSGCIHWLSAANTLVPFCPQTPRTVGFRLLSRSA